jgi:dienelactone hydrolase
MRIYISIFLIFIGLSSYSIAQQTGQYKIEATPLSILGDDTAAAFNNIIDKNDKISWDIYVPTIYDASNPPGVMVYVSHDNRTDIPVGWLKIMEERNIIWIAAYMSGESFATQKRVLKAALALPLVQQKYNINADRVYVSGFSNGANIAAIVSMDFPHMFKGAVYNNSALFWKKNIPTQLDLLKKNRFAFVVGKNDPYLLEMREVHRRYKKAGVEASKLIVIPRWPHKRPNRRRFLEAIEYIDQDYSE